MAFDVEELRTDSAKETEGVWHEIGPGARARIARWMNPEMRKLVLIEARKVRHQTSAGVDLSDVADDKLNAIMADHLLLEIAGDWTMGGRPLKNTTKDRLAVLEIRAIREIVVGLAEDASNYRLDAEKAAAGNSRSESGGNADAA